MDRTRDRLGPEGAAVRVVGGTMLRAGARRAARGVRSTSLAFLLVLAPAMGSGARDLPRRTGVEAPRIDMSNDESATRSMTLVNETLDQGTRSAFLRATLVLVDREMGDVGADTADPVRAREAVRRVLDGRTAAEVIAAART